MTKKKSRGDLMKNDWNDKSVPWSEESIQIAFVQSLLRLEKKYDFTFASSLEGVKLTKGQANKQKMLGMRSGEPDVRIYVSGGKVVFVELKRGISGGQRAGKLSDNQLDRHDLLANLGFEVVTATYDTPSDAKEGAENIIKYLFL